MLKECNYGGSLFLEFQPYDLEHCYRGHFVSVALELMLGHATECCERRLVAGNRHAVYCIVTV